jgi:hypothetical protein
MNKILNKKNIPSFVLYAFALLLVIYAVWAYTHCADIISQAKAAGQLAASGNEYDIMSFYMGNCCQYIIYALLLAAAGLVLQRKQSTTNIPEVTDAPIKNSEADDELDELFNDADDE